jgi:hypothetical protein
MIDYSHPDLTQHPPRCVRVRLGPYIHLPRMLDKVRAFAGGKIGEYVYPCPLDKQLLGFLGIDPDAVLAEVKKGRSDGEMLAWFNAQTKRTEVEIDAWSNWREQQGPGSADAHGRFSASLTKAAPHREDIQTSFDRLDLDDYVSFGGKG